MNSDSTSSLIKTPYDLLLSYGHQSKIKSKAYGMSSSYYRNLHKWLTYPQIILSAVSTISAVIDINQYALISLNVSMLILVGFNQAIQPKQRENDAHQYAIEYSELYSNIKQFININNRTQAEIKAYTAIILDQMNVWDSLSPPCRDKYLQKATKLYAKRSRTSRRTQKKEIAIDIH